MQHGLTAPATAPATPGALAARAPGLAEIVDHRHDTDTFGPDVIAGLSRRRKAIPPKYFYDARGSALFDRICALPDYYLTRTELDLLKRHAPAMAKRIGRDACLVEFGCGSLTKARLLLDRMPSLSAFVPIDISRDHLLTSAEDLARDYPAIAVSPVCADFTRRFTLPEVAEDRRRVGFFPGSTIGNMEPEAAASFLRGAADMLGSGGGLLIGVDLVKDDSVLNAAYNDTEGVTAAFNLNLLTRINRELCGSFEPRGFRHEAFWNAETSRIEMHLVSRHAQRVHVSGRCFAFQEGESIHTENSYKYTVEGFQALAERAGYRPVQVWTDPARLFSLHFLDVV